MQLTIVQEINEHQNVVGGFYRILESYPTTDGWRSRITTWRHKDFKATQAEVERRKAIMQG